MGSEPSFCDLDFSHGRSSGFGRGIVFFGLICFCSNQFACWSRSYRPARSWSVIDQCVPCSDVAIAEVGSRWNPRTRTYRSRQESLSVPTSPRR
jgi:hypothetical protein